METAPLKKVGGRPPRLLKAIVKALLPYILRKVLLEEFDEDYNSLDRQYDRAGTPGKFRWTKTSEKEHVLMAFQFLTIRLAGHGFRHCNGSCRRFRRPTLP
jgi:hypothetical protein